MDDQLNNLWEIELDVLKCNIKQNSAAENVIPCLLHLQRGAYDVLITSNTSHEVFTSGEDITLETYNTIDYLRNKVNNYLSKHETSVDHFEVLCIGVACINGFIQSNWTGSAFKCPKSLTDLITPAVRIFFPDAHKDVAECLRLVLEEDGGEICASIINPELLIVAQAIFSSDLSYLRTADWWLLRSTYIHQQILDEQSPTLQEHLNNLLHKVHSFNWLNDYKYFQVLSHLEAARIYLHYGKISSSDTEIKKALSLLKMEINLSGALGKRTFYQTREVAQLTINVEVDRQGGVESAADSYELNLPKDVLLNDEVRLPNTAFSNPKEGDYPQLQPLEQAALLSVFVFQKKSQAKDHLQNELLLPYLNCLLSHPKVWSFQISGLFLRSRIESENKRTVERALLQTQSLMELNTDPTPVPARLHLFYCSYAPPSFIISSVCANILVSLGSIQSALEIFKELQMWEEVVSCYRFLKLLHKAADVIKEQLKKGKTVKLLCSLGDVTDDVTCYEQAWELSDYRSAQAQRHWGQYYFNKKMYKESIKHFKISLSINSLQIPLWFRLGYAALMEHEWEESASAYRRYCVLEPDSFEAWNNLAKAYILLGQKHRAFNALQEAIKCNYDTWQVWDNLMAVSSDCGDFEEVIRCYHRIMDLKDKHIDEQILNVLTSVIVNNVRDCKGQPASVHRKKALELFGRITSKVMGNQTMWQLYAQLTLSIEDQTPITRSKVAQYYQKACTTATQDDAWLQSLDSIKQVANIAKNLGEAHLVLVKHSTSDDESARLLNSAKCSVNSVYKRIKYHMEMNDLNSSILEHVEALEKLLELIDAEICKSS